MPAILSSIRSKKGNSRGEKYFVAEDLLVGFRCSTLGNMSYRQRVLTIYQAYAQDKVASVDKTLEKYAGAEDQLIAALVQKYGPEPVAGAAPAPSAAAPSAGDYRARVLAMYQAYAQDKVASVDKTLEKYAGAEDHLIAALVQKYGPEPVARVAPACIPSTELLTVSPAFLTSKEKR
jgi:hypothetical protein